MIFHFKNSRIKKKYWKIFFIISVISFLCHQVGITSMIDSNSDGEVLAILIPSMYLVFNPFIIWILELIYD